MPHNLSLLGVDIGSVSVSMVEIDGKREQPLSLYAFHCGEPGRCFKSLLEKFDLSAIGGIALTSSTPSFLLSDHRYDDRVCLMKACEHLHGRVGSILVVGGEKFGLIRYDAEGNYQGYKGNTSCAAGTGSFLDQQARRLGLDGIQSLSLLARANRGAVPGIASRCAVFAKTDLVHAQQEGFSLEEICDGLCCGLAQNIATTLFAGPKALSPIVFVGGVSLNEAVVRHLERCVGQHLIVDGALGHGALGAALLLREELPAEARTPVGCVDSLFASTERLTEHRIAPLRLEKSSYPDFSTGENGLLFTAGEREHPVEWEFFEPVTTGSELQVCLGIDVGSTSTKAVLLNSDRRVAAGFYTRTGGRPLMATQRILAAIDELLLQQNLPLKILGAATTGSGRKFIGTVLGADLVLNEISAHARAAVHLNPEVDTIIEIGGQDSKFTTLSNGRVTFSVMNTVCAAGTGSFIEEQAAKLGCSLDEIAQRTEGKSAPLSSDRCTVFMERDLNHFLNRGYSVDEVLASVLHSVRDNYLARVAVQSQIGQTILFQGATAKNRALVAAFEQRLGKPIQVSRFCHLAGAMGVALALLEALPSNSSFRGIAICRRSIPVRSEVCSLCTNHCKLTVGNLDGVDVACGFLCGRDYATPKLVKRNPSGFDLLRTRRRLCAVPHEPVRHPGWSVCVPAALHLFEDLPFWKFFFAQLGVPVRTSETFLAPVEAGKKVTGAEFCAPITAFYGHVAHLADSDKKVAKQPFLFLPVYLERQGESLGSRRKYCYYTQYASPLSADLLEKRGVPDDRILTPLVHYLYHSFHTKTELYRMLSRISKGKIGFLEVSSAFDKALEFRANCSGELRRLYDRETKGGKSFHVVLLGRPYTVLAESMNKGLPGIFASLGVKAFFQDMLSISEEDSEPIRDLIDDLQWYHAGRILAAACKVARSRSAYPVLITSFKCTPDSFLIEYFKEIMAFYRKPYLVLQLDEHSSAVGYETRIEAAVESFRNHHISGRELRRSSEDSRGLPRTSHTDLKGKTLLLPSWDNLTFPLVAAALRREGFDARLLRWTPTTVARSLQKNTGQCTPLNIIAQEFIDYVREHGLDPSASVLWLVESNIACNICMFPRHIRTILRSAGAGFERSEVYAGHLSFGDLSIKLPVNIYFAYMFGGLLRKLLCRIRPYECLPGETERALDTSMQILEEAFLGRTPREQAVQHVVSLFEGVRTRPSPRPRVAIFGDLYVRDNDVINQDLIRFIETHGGEVVTMPYSAYVRMVSRPYLRKWIVEGDFLGALSSKAVLAMVGHLERTYLRRFRRLLDDCELEFSDDPGGILSRHHVRLEHTGESMEHLLKVHYLKKHYPDISLFVQTSPAFCCPSLVTEAMAERIERYTGVPVVSVTYDGTGGNKNEAIIPYLKFPRATHSDRLVQIV